MNQWRTYKAKRPLSTRYYVARWMNGYEFSYSRSGATRYFRNLEEAERFATYLNLPEAERQEIDAAHSLRYFYA